MVQQQHSYDYLASLSPPSAMFLTSPDNSKATLWMGDLESWMDESYIRQFWASLSEDVVVKVIRDKRTGASAGYAFVEFTSTLAAQDALLNYHGAKVPAMQKTIRLNWASGGGIHDRKEDRAPEYSLFVGDLSGDVDETLLLNLFRRRYSSCHSAKVMTDPLTGMSRGYGFVRFHDPHEHQNALTEMNGVYCGERPMRVSLATPKNSNARYHQLALQAPALVHQPTDPNNTTVFIGGLSSTPVSEEDLRQCFAPYGEIVYVKIPPNKGCGFVQYVSRQSAEMAIEQMNGFQIGSSRIRLSWGRSQNDKTALNGITTTSTSDTWQQHQKPQQLQQQHQTAIAQQQKHLPSSPFLPSSPTSPIHRYHSPPIASATIASGTSSLLISPTLSYQRGHNYLDSAFSAKSTGSIPLLPSSASIMTTQISHTSAAHTHRPKTSTMFSPEIAPATDMSWLWQDGGNSSSEHEGDWHLNDAYA
ncbi:hypothetical protein BX666DRAFT_1939737 [Dichotomocladium elegans]|nr:hypothetical protein BX666DRAFT_1939737 [Dichotomocladium elegans]